MKQLTKEKFNALLKQIGSGKKRALRQFYDLYGKFIYFSAYSVCRSKADADEIVNEVLLKIWKITSSSLIVINNPEGWLYKIATNMAKNKIEIQNLELKSNIVDKNNKIDEFLSNDAFYSYLSILSEQEREILLERFVLKMKFEEIAESMQMPLSTLTSQYYRILQKIKENLEFMSKKT